MYSHAEPGLMRGMGHGGEYAFCWRGQSGVIRSDTLTVDTSKSCELTGWFKADGTGLVSVVFGIVPEADAIQQAQDAGENFSKRGKWIGFVKQDISCAEWTELKLIVDPKHWWPGVKKAQVIISPIRMEGASALWIDDMALRVVRVGFGDKD